MKTLKLTRIGKFILKCRIKLLIMFYKDYQDGCINDALFNIAELVENDIKLAQRLLKRIENL